MRAQIRKLFFLFFLFLPIVLADDLTNPEVGMLHLWTFTLFLSIGIFFMVLMHKYSDNLGASVAFGTISATTFLILLAMILSGYSVIASTTVFFIKVDYFIGIVLAGLALYSSLNARFLYQEGKKRQLLAQAE